MCKTVVEPVVLGAETDENTRRPTMASDDDLFRLGYPQVARQIILDLG